MQRITTLLQKLTELSAKVEKNTIIDVDLMLDYTRVLYADILDWRNKIAAAKPVVQDNLQNKHTEPATPFGFAGKLNTTHSPNKKDVRHNIGINDKYQLISELFLNKKDLYESALDEINNFETYHQAYIWLQRHYNWDDENPTAVNFYSILNNFFSGKQA